MSGSYISKHPASSTVRYRWLLLTPDAFVHWLVDHTIHIETRSPSRVMPCTCGDLNCHGWKFVALGSSTAVVDRPRVGEHAAW